MHDIDALGAQVIYNLIAAALFIGLVGLIPEPWRQRTAATMATLAAFTYITHELGAWEYAFMIALIAAGLAGFRSYPAIGIAWLIHTLSDVFHHSAGMPMVASIPLSSFGCAIFDPLIAIWFFYGAPSRREIFDALKPSSTPPPTAAIP